jgi:hypothetical protein
VATPDEQKTDYSNAALFVRAIAEKVLLAIKHTNLATEEKGSISSAIEEVSRK